MENNSALALYEGTREDDLVSEEIDERVLKLLGLDDVFDIDYGTYITLLKERLAASRSFAKKLSTEEDELLVGEFRRVKGNVGRFKVRKKKITSENIGVTGPVKVSSEKFFLTTKAIIPQPESKKIVGDDSETIDSIKKSLDNIVKNLTDQNKRARKSAEETRKSEERKSRRQRETDLEKPIKKSVSLLKKLISPAQSILDRIFRFIGFTLLGFFVDKVLKWFADPENERKIKVIGRFLKDWWPSLAFAAGLFLTPLGAFIRTTITLLRGFSSKILALMAANPKVFGTIALTVGSAVAGTYLETKMKGVDETLLKRKIEESKEKGKPLSEKEIEQIRLNNLQKRIEDVRGTNIPGSALAGGGLVKRRSFFNGGQIEKEVNVNDIAFDGGGGISDNSGLRITGAGPDTQLIAAQPGEVVISKKAVDKYGANFFLDLNKRSGGTNIPRMVNNIQLAQGGGLIGALGRFLPGTGTVMSPRGMSLGFQDKLFGINVGSRREIPLTQTYSPGAVDRYNRSPNSPSVLQLIGGSGPLSNRHISLPKISTPSSRVTQKSSIQSSTNQRLNKSIQNAMDITNTPGAKMYRPLVDSAAKTSIKAQKKYDVLREAMKDAGMSGANENMNLYGKPILGPQSSVMPVGKPVIISRSQTIMLPPQKIGTNTKSSIQTGNQIPNFRAIANVPHRDKVISSLGISELMGVG